MVRSSPLNLTTQISTNQGCPRGNASELAALAKDSENLLPYRLAYQGGVGYLPRMLMQVIFNQICG